jgi:segregation and condensation protein A
MGSHKRISMTKENEVENIQLPDQNQSSELLKDDAYQFSLDEFEGPLDLLLFLIKKNEVSIYDIPIAQITEQYLEIIALGNIDLDKASEFHLMAATLLYIKSRMLLPVEIDLDDELDDPRRELVERLIEYQKYKRLSELMAKQEEESLWNIERRKKQRILPFPQQDDVWQKMDVWDLLKTFSKLMSNISSERILDLYEEVSVNEKITLINEFLEKKDSFLFTDLLTRENSIMDLVCAFLAILESVKIKLITIFQNAFFGDIQIRARAPEERLDLELANDTNTQEPEGG